MAKMEISYNVHGVSTSTIPFQTEHRGIAVTATTEAFEVELTATDARHWSATLRFIGEEVPKARELFKAKATIVAMLVDEASRESVKE